MLRKTLWSFTFLSLLFFPLALKPQTLAFGSNITDKIAVNVETQETKYLLTYNNNQS